MGLLFFIYYIKTTITNYFIMIKTHSFYYPVERKHSNAADWLQWIKEQLQKRKIRLNYER